MKTITKPKKRECERCGRKDVWDDDAETWVAAEEDSEPQRGVPHCLHEWDINGSFSPVEGE